MFSLIENSKRYTKNTSQLKMTLRFCTVTSRLSSNVVCFNVCGTRWKLLSDNRPLVPFNELRLKDKFIINGFR